MGVCNEVEPYNLCNSYALKKGFSICKGNIRRDVKNNIRERDYLCSNLCEVKTVHQLDTRTGCRALIRFTVDDGVWKISHINSYHNHEFAKLEERQFLKSGRKIQKAHANVMSSMVEAGIRPTKSYSYLAKEVGGAENVGFTKKDCLNYLHRKKEELIEGGDAQSLINHFKHKQAEDPNFFYIVQVDQCTRMTNFFFGEMVDQS
ncbi:PREDICTED: FAR1-RELATED SEQUENCE [Prunus dulcis]|uniref:PREDICTED: FAR1-RELATED SEQUENCE n=1 Tax=Prunus dulcis TaxID=3755 RepID=A0A5E4FQR1_PRUDU|nr:PREDICTED: FAR1-RELATED SEQUENCE [Prunus dulcis]